MWADDLGPAGAATAMPSVSELAERGADLAALRLLARTDRSALAATLKELGFSKMGHRMELEKALLVEADSAEPEAGVAAAVTTAAEEAEHCGKDEDEARVEKEVDPPATGGATAKPPAEALGKATAARVAQLLVAEAEAAASAEEAAAAERLWAQVAVLTPAHAAERPLADAGAALPSAEATAAAVVEAAAPVAVAAPEAAVGKLSAEGAVPAEDPASARAASLRAEGSEAYREGRHGRAEDLYTRALALTPGDATLLSNRSAARLQLGRPAAALEDALAAAAARPGWGKAQLRAAAAYEALGDGGAAVASYEAAARCEPLGQLALTALARLRAASSGEAPRGGSNGGGNGGTAAETQLVVGGVAAAREAVRLGQVGDAMIMLDAAVRPRRPPPRRPPPRRPPHPSRRPPQPPVSCSAPEPTPTSPLPRTLPPLALTPSPTPSSTTTSSSPRPRTTRPTWPARRRTPRCSGGPPRETTRTRRPTSPRRGRGTRGG